MSVEIVRRDNGNIARSNRGGKAGLEIRSTGSPVKIDLIPQGGFLYVVIDCSTSMEGGDKLNKAKRGAIDFSRDAIAKNYQVGLIGFGDFAHHYCAPQKQIPELERCMESMHACGSTNMADAIRQARESLKRGKGLKAMLVATDGCPDSVPDALKEANRAKAEGIDILTVGTDDADLDFLKKLASRSTLAVKVPQVNFREGMASMAKMLPDGKTQKTLATQIHAHATAIPIFTQPMPGS